MARTELYSDYSRGKQEYNEAQSNYECNCRGGLRKYYWMAVVREGKAAILGYRLSEAEATDYVMTNCPGEHFEIFPSDSKDIHKVSGQIKSRILEKCHDLDAATQRNILKQSEQMSKNKGTVTYRTNRKVFGY